MAHTDLQSATHSPIIHIPCTMIQICCTVEFTVLTERTRLSNFMTAHNTHKNIHHSGLWINLGLLSVFKTDIVLLYKVVIKLIIHKMVIKGPLSPRHLAILDAIHKESLILILMTYVQLSTLVKSL